jgi:LuxR family maltose regulon positive regulatory protein
LTELRAIDLRFTPSEAADFLNGAMGLDLSAEDVATLEDRTEGWIAGLQLAALALQGRRSASSEQDAKAFISSFGGSHRFVLDYLIEEVIEQQSEAKQSFLLKTAVLDRLNGVLCDALTGRGDGQETLQALERANLFIVGLDEERRWYRYHHLFAELLRRRLRQQHPDWPPILYQKASDWSERHGLAAESIEYAMRSKDYARAALVLEGQLNAFWGKGKHVELQRWLNSLPEEVLFIRPHLAIFQARYQCNNGQWDAAERTLSAAEKALATAEQAPGIEEQVPQVQADRLKLHGRVAATKALMRSYRGDVPGIIQYANEALEILPEDDLTWRSVTALTLGNAYGFMGDMAAAYEARFKALQSCQASSDRYFISIANLELAITLREMGRLGQTVEICREQFRVIKETGMAQTTVAGWLLAIWGETLAETNDLDEALERAEQGYALAEQGRDLQMLGWSFMCLTRVLFSRGDLAEANRVIGAMENRGRDSQIPPWIANQATAWQARIWLAQDNVAPAAHWAKERGLDNGELRPIPQIGFFSLFDYLTLARILIAQERLGEAANLLEHLCQAAEAGERTSGVIEVLALQALTFSAGDDEDKALKRLAKALNLAKQDGFVRVFVDAGAPMAALLAKFVASDQMLALSKDDSDAFGQSESMRTYLQRLLAAFPGGGDGQRAGDDQGLAFQLSSAQTPRPQPLLESLSERELEVLELIAKGLTNREIASRLFLSLNTVKVHTRNIYGKLDAHNRVQAVAKARTLGILSSS